MRVIKESGPPLPSGVAYEWARVSRRHADLQVRLEGRLIFHALTDGRPWSPDDVCVVLRSRPGVSA